MGIGNTSPGEENGLGIRDCIPESIFPRSSSPLTSTFPPSSRFLSIGDDHHESGHTKNACIVPVRLRFW